MCSAAWVLVAWYVDDRTVQFTCNKKRFVKRLIRSLYVHTVSYKSQNIYNCFFSCMNKIYVVIRQEDLPNLLTSLTNCGKLGQSFFSALKRHTIHCTTTSQVPYTACVEGGKTIKYWVEWANAVTYYTAFTNWTAGWLIVTNNTKIGHSAYILYLVNYHY